MHIKPIPGRINTDETFPVPSLRMRVSRQPDRVAGTLGFKKLVDLGIGKSGVTSEIQMLHDAPVTRNHRLQQRAPAVSTVDVARPQCASLDVVELVEHKQWMVAGASEVMVWTTAATRIECRRVVAAVTPHAGSYRDGDCDRRS